MSVKKIALGALSGLGAIIIASTAACSPNLLRVHYDYFTTEYTENNKAKEILKLDKSSEKLYIIEKHVVKENETIEQILIDSIGNDYYRGDKKDEWVSVVKDLNDLDNAIIYPEQVLKIPKPLEAYFNENTKRLEFVKHDIYE